MEPTPNIIDLIIKKLYHVSTSGESSEEVAKAIAHYARTLYEITSLNPEFTNQKQGETA